MPKTPPAKPTKTVKATPKEKAALDAGLRSGNAEAEELAAMKAVKAGKKPNPPKFKGGGKVCAPKGKK